MTGVRLATTAPVRSVHPPALVMRVVNPVTRALARSRIGARFGSLTVLEFEGRRSGKHYAIPVVAHEYDGVSVVFTDARWYANFDGGAPVVVRRAGRTSKGVGRLVSDSAAAAAGLRSVLAGLKSPRGVGLAIDAGHVPTDAELSCARHMIRLEVDPA